MHYAFPFLPLEVQTSIKEMLALGMPEFAVDLLIDRTAKALEAKTTSLQVSIERIETSLETRVDKIGEKLVADLRTQHGETNGMLVDVRSAQQEAGRGIADIKKAWEQMDIWRGQVDIWRGTLDARMEGLAGDVDALTQEIHSRRPFFDEMLKEIANIKHENLQDELDREERIALTSGLRRMLARWEEVEALLAKQAGT